MSKQQQPTEATATVRETETGFFAMFSNFYASVCYFFSMLARLFHSADEGAKVIETYSIYTSESVTAQLNADYDKLQKELADNSKD